eukprot:m.474647 g.474647  ORF g.474647 m.474647 type:complete len:86 (+) comp36724_c0_seq1:187-444(+)
MYVNNTKCSASHEMWEVGDVVDVRGRFLMLHASITCAAGRASRLVTLPFVGTVQDETQTTICEQCASFTTAPMAPGEVLLYTIQR